MAPISRDDCVEMDLKDPLAVWREAFLLSENLIYLDGNSLGPLSKEVEKTLSTTIREQWGEGLIGSWNDSHWIDLPERVGDKIAPLVGADAGEVIASDSVSVNIFKLAAAAVRMVPKRSVLITEPGNFPTDLYMLQGLKELLGDQLQLILVEPDRLADGLSSDTALVLLTHVHYKTGRMLDMGSITQQVQDAGALMLWDLSHSTGAVPVELNQCNVDFAVGCGYKYLNGGPGAPGYAFVASRHQAGLRQPLTGWFGHQNPFAMSDDYQPADGIRQLLSGTPSVLGLSALEAAVGQVVAADIHKLRYKSLQLSRLFEQLVSQRLAPYGFTSDSPDEPEQRGSQVALLHPSAYAIVQALIAAGVVGDFRPPNVLRFGLAPLYLRFQDIWDAVTTLAEIMESGRWQDDEFSVRKAVT